MKNFPSLTAVIGAWLCAFGFVLPGIGFFLIGSGYSLIVEEKCDGYTITFFFANLVAFGRLTS